MENKKKVCFLIPSVKSGGIETYLLRFLKLKGDEIDATVLVRNSKKGELYDAYKATGATIIFKPLGYFNIQSINWYHQFFKKKKFDTICDFNGNFAGLPMVVGKMAGVKKRITFYRQGNDHFKKSIGKRFYNNLMNSLVYKFSTDIFANSEAGLSFFFSKKYPIDTRFKVIRNGVNIGEYNDQKETKVDIRKRLNLPADSYIIGHTGRFTEAKNHYFLLDVMKELMLQIDNLYLVLVGNDTNQLLPYIEKLSIADKCTVLGYQSNIPDYLSAFDLYFFPSITEGQPNALIEAMISGLPIVASNIPSIQECVPLQAKKSLIDVKNIDETVNQILVIMKTPAKYTYQEFAIENFNAEIQFSEFLKNL